MSAHSASSSQQEVPLTKQDQLVSTTDLKGVITYCNDTFCRIAGFQEHELLGQNHNIVRHNDMPKAAFADLWKHLKLGVELSKIELKITVIIGLMPMSPPFMRMGKSVVTNQYELSLSSSGLILHQKPIKHCERLSNQKSVSQSVLLILFVMPFYSVP